MSALPFALRSDPSSSFSNQGNGRQEEFRADLSIKLTCPNCNDPTINLIEEFGSGDLVCGGCGLVLGDKIVDTRSEWRTFANDEGDDPSRVGTAVDPLLSASEQFATTISYKDNQSGQSKMLQMAASRVTKAQSKGTRDLAAGFRDIGDMCAIISLPKIVVDASKQLFKRADDEGILRKKNVNAVIAACIFIGCRQQGVARSFKEIHALTKVDKKAIAECFKELEKAFVTANLQNTAPSNTETALIARFCNQLGLEKPLPPVAAHVIRQVREHGILDGRDPSTIAGACIFFASRLFGRFEITTEKLEQVTGMKAATMKAAFDLLMPKRDMLVKDDWFELTRALTRRADWSNLDGKKERKATASASSSAPGTPPSFA